MCASTVKQNPSANNAPKSIAAEAEQLIHGDRRDDYGDMVVSFEAIARIWNTILYLKAKDKPLVLDKHDVALMMAGLKLIREANKHKRDNLVDFCGYALCAQEMHEDN